MVDGYDNVQRVDMAYPYSTYPAIRQDRNSNETDVLYISDIEGSSATIHLLDLKNGLIKRSEPIPFRRESYANFKRS